MFVFAAMAEFAFVLFIKQNGKWKNINEIDGPSGTTCNRLAIDTGNDAAKAVCNVAPQITNTVNLVESKDREIRQTNVWSNKCVIFYGLSFPTKLDCAGFFFYYLGYLIFNCVYIVWATKTYYGNK